MQDYKLNKLIDLNKKEIPDFHNVVSLFDLLLKIDKRNNPELYKQQSK